MAKLATSFLGIGMLCAVILASNLVLTRPVCACGEIRSPSDAIAFLGTNQGIKLIKARWGTSHFTRASYKLGQYTYYLMGDSSRAKRAKDDVSALWLAAESIK